MHEALIGFSWIDPEGFREGTFIKAASEEERRMFETYFKDIPRAVEHLSYFLPMLGYAEVACGNNIAGNSSFSDQSNARRDRHWRRQYFQNTILHTETLRVSSPRLMDGTFDGKRFEKIESR